jgi:cytochrome P450
MHNSEVASKLSAEICSVLPGYDDDSGKNVSYAGLESQLPYTMACIRENFRMSAVFNMPLPRVVTDPRGVEISGHHIPQGVSIPRVPKTAVIS